MFVLSTHYTQERGGKFAHICTEEGNEVFKESVGQIYGSNVTGRLEEERRKLKSERRKWRKFSRWFNQVNCNQTDSMIHGLEGRERERYFLLKVYLRNVQEQFLLNVPCNENVQ